MKDSQPAVGRSQAEGASARTGSSFVQMRQEMAGMSVAAQREHVQPARPLQLSRDPAPVQKLDAPVQFAPSKRHVDIDSIIPLNQMGPYQYVPEAKKFICNDLNSLTADELWDACLATTSYGPETATVVVSGTTVAKADPTQRIAKAKQKLLGGAGDAAFNAILSHSNGTAPRPFTTVAAEVGFNAHAHCHDRHVFGAGTIGDIVALATRAAMRTPFAPGDDGIASAWTNIGAADSVVATGIATAFTDWSTMRVKIARGSGLDAVDAPLAGSVIALQKTDPPPATAYNPTDLPTYRGGTGYRPLYPGEPEWDTAKSTATTDQGSYTDTAKGNPLTTNVTTTVTKASVVLKADAASPGGWYVLTAYPST